LPTFVTRQVEFDAGHRVPNHESKCRNPHGHRYKVVATVTGRLVDRSGASDEGMVLDFGVLSELLQFHVHDKYDHGFIVYENDDVMQRLFWDADDQNWKVIHVDWIPTAENMARAIFEDLYPEVVKMTDDGRVLLTGIEVWETPKSMVSYWAGTQ